MRNGIQSILSVLFIDLISSGLSKKVEQRGQQEMNIIFMKGAVGFWLLLTATCLLNPVSVSAATDLDQYTYSANVSSLRTDTTSITQYLGSFASYGEALAAIRNVHPNAQYFIPDGTTSYPSVGNSTYRYIIAPESIIRSNWFYSFNYVSIPWSPSEASAKQNYIQRELALNANHSPPLCSIDSITDVDGWKPDTSGACPLSAQIEGEEKRNQITGVWSYGCASSSTWYAYSCRQRNLTCPAQTPYLNRQQQQCMNPGQAQIYEKLVACGEGRILNKTTGQCEIAPYEDKKNLGGCIPETPSTPLIGHPVNAATGNKFLSQRDYTGNSPSALSFKRYYNSYRAEASSLGLNWRASVERQFVYHYADSTITFTLADGKQFTLRYYGYNEQYKGHEFRPTGEENIRVVIEIGGEWRAFYLRKNNTVEYYYPRYVTSEIAEYELRSIIYPDGQTQTYTHNANGQVSSIENQLGESLQFAYDGQGRIDVMSAPGNRSWQYQYDANNHLTAVINPDNTTRLYHYENVSLPNALTGITDERGVRYATYQYDTYNGKATRTTLANNVERYDLAYNGLTTTVTNSRGNTSIYTLIDRYDGKLLQSIAGPGCTSCGGGDVSYEYYGNKNLLLAKTEQGMRTEYPLYDSDGRVKTRIEAAGTSGARTTTYTYDTRFNNKISTKTEPSVCTTGNKVTVNTYDNFGNTTGITVNGKTPSCIANSRTTTLQYTGPLNQLSQIDGPRTDVSDITTLSYYLNDVSEGSNRARLKSVTSGGIVLRDNLQYTASGKLLSESRPNGLTISYTYYPGNDRLETVTQSDGVDSRTTRWTYLATGEVASITLGDGTLQSTTITLGYNAARRLTRITDQSGNYMEYTLDTEGNRTAENIYDSASILKRSLTQTFDVYNRLDTTAQANENSNYNFSVDGTLDTQVDGKLTTTKYTYDKLKRLSTTTQDVGGTDTSTADALAQYGYDTQDHLTSVIDPVNGNTTYSYDDLGNLLSQTSPDTGTTVFTYDEAGNVKTRLDAMSQNFTYSYDALNRLTLLDAPGTSEDMGYVYDTCTNGAGRLCSITQGTTNTTSYAYNAFGDVTAHQGIQYAYDALGRLDTMTYPSGNSVTYIYNANGQISQVDAVVNGVSQTLASGITYVPFGPVTNLTYGNGALLTQSFDSAYRMTSQSIPGIYERTYSVYDANGNLKTRNDIIANSSEAFNFDNLNRIVNATGTYGAQGFGYDKNGNRLSLTQGTTTTTNTYQPASNRLSQVGANVISLDANGNTQNDGKHTYSFDSLNRLMDVDTTLATYQYNALGQRTRKTANGANVVYLYDLFGHLIENRDTHQIDRIHQTRANSEAAIPTPLSCNGHPKTGIGSP